MLSELRIQKISCCVGGFVHNTSHLTSKIEKQLLQWSCINVHQHFMKIVKIIILFHLFLGASSILNWHCFDGPPGAGSEGYQHSRAWHILQTSTTCWIRPR